MSAEMNEVCQDYESTLQELKNNSKPHINMLTMLADENQRYASKITQIIESRIEKVSILLSFFTFTSSFRLKRLNIAKDLVFNYFFDDFCKYFALYQSLIGVQVIIVIFRLLFPNLMKESKIH